MNRRAARITFVAVVTGALLGAVLLLARLVLHYVPWRATEVITMSAVAVVAAAVISRFAVESRRLRIAWGGLIAIGWLAVGAAYLGSYRHTYTTNVRPILEYVDLSRIAGLDGAPLDAVVLARHFASRPATPLAALPRIHLGWSDSARVVAGADDLLASRFRLGSYPVVDLPEDLTWREDPLRLHPWRWRLHNMPYVVTLTRAYVATGHLPYLERAEELVLDWIGDNSAYVMEPPSAYVWNDHSTAMRLANWLFFWEIWTKSPLYGPVESSQVLGSMLGHVERLASSDFYWENHNHGIDQDRALLAFALLFPELRQSDEWRELALDRLARQFRRTISPSGVHLEHSPGYHFDIMSRAAEIQQTLQHYGLEKAFGLDLVALQQRMARFAATTVQPSGQIAAIGDTRPTTLEDYELDSPHVIPWLEYALTRGKSGTLFDTTIAYMSEGYAMVRNFGGGALSYDRSFYLFFTAAAHEVTGLRAHKHADDLSFILSYGGQEFLIDAGLYDYARDEKRDYVVGPTAHNVVVADGVEFGGWDSTLDEFTTTPEMTLIRASHRNLSGFDHRRWIVHVKPRTVFLIDDVRPLRADGAVRDFRQLFHLAPGLEVVATQEPRGFTAAPTTDEACPMLQLTQLYGAPETRVVAGEHEPMLGWHTAAVGVLEPSPTALFTTSGVEALFVTRIELLDCLSDATRGDSRRNGTVLLPDGELSISGVGERGRKRLRVDLHTGTVQFDST